MHNYLVFLDFLHIHYHIAYNYREISGFFLFLFCYDFSWRDGFH